MPEKSIAQKLSIKAGYRVRLVNPPAGYLAQMGQMPAGCTISKDSGEPAEVIQVFVSNRRSWKPSCHV